MNYRFREIVERLGGRDPTSKNSVSVRCPCHSDKRESLRITLSGGRILFHCFAGCETKEILEWLGLSFKDVTGESEVTVREATGHIRTDFVERKEKKKSLVKTSSPDLFSFFPYEVVARYDYFSHITGLYLYSNIRYRTESSPKNFIQIRFCYMNGYIAADGDFYIYGNGGWRSYFGQFNPDGVTFLVEGEKDCLSLLNQGEYAVTAGSASAEWHCEWFPLLGGNYVIIPDNDEPGVKAANELARMLERNGKKYDIYNVPSKYKDITEMMENE